MQNFSTLGIDKSYVFLALSLLFLNSPASKSGHTLRVAFVADVDPS